MKSSEHIINVSEADFEYEVVAFSQQKPVVVDFWAEWCVPCRTLGPALERLAQEAEGTIRLAKINVDENPNLSRRFNVRSIPTVKAFSNGQVVAEFVGLLPEPKLREFVRALVVTPGDLGIEKAQSLLQKEQWTKAEDAFREALSETPDSPAARLGLIKSLLAQGRAAEAQRLLEQFPTSKEFAAAELLRPLAAVLHKYDHVSQGSDEPLEAAYQNALRLVSRGNIEAALDGLLDVLRQDKRFHADEARRVILALFEILGDEKQITREYRNELASILF